MSQRIGMQRLLQLQRRRVIGTAANASTTRSVSSLLGSSLSSSVFSSPRKEDVPSRFTFAPLQQLQLKPRCCFYHASPLTLKEEEEEKELSPKDQKKLLKQKAKAATAAAAAEAEKKDNDEQTDVPAVEKAAAPEAPKEQAAAPAAVVVKQPEETETLVMKEYSTKELTRDAAAHKAGLNDKDSDRPGYQNPLHHNNPEMTKLFRQDFDSDEDFQAAMQPVPAFDNDTQQGQEESSTAAPEYLHEIASEIVHLSMLEMNELINKIGDHYGFNEGMLSPDDDAAGGGGGDFDDDDDGEAAAPVEEKTIFDIKLVAFDPKSKIKVIKEVRAIAGLGLKEAKEMVEGAPKVVLKDIKKEQAEEIKAKLEELGATIEIV